MGEAHGFAAPKGSLFPLAALALLALVALSIGSAPIPQAGEQAEQAALDAYGKLPLAFVPNEGQTDERVRFQAQAGGHSFYFTPDKAVLSFTKGKRGAALHLTPLGSSPDTRLEASDRLPGKVNYISGSERHANISTYRELSYQNLWPGIDMVFRGQGGALKYEFRLRPGADPSRIRLAYRGAEGLSLGAAGNLLIQTPLGPLRDSRPRSYQRAGGKRVPVESRYALQGGNAYGFALGLSYDRRRPLVIDPGIEYSTALGGGSFDTGRAIGVDSAGSAYVVGETQSADFPVTPGAYDPAPDDVFVTKLDPSGSSLAYSTYLGGAGFEQANAIAVDGSGNAYLAGYTQSTDFPTTAGAYDGTKDESGPFSSVDAFLTKLNPSGAGLAYSTYLGGSGDDIGHGLALDSAGNAYVSGQTTSTNFPTTLGAYDETSDGSSEAFVTKFNSSGSALAYSTSLGGVGTDHAEDLAVDSSGNAYVSGGTSSTDFPTTPGAYDGTSNGAADAFVTKLSSSGSSLAYSTFLGGSGSEQLRGIALDSSGRAHVAGITPSADFPTTSGAHDASLGGPVDAFVTKLDLSGSSLAYSTFVGGAAEDRAFNVAVDGGGAAYITGNTRSLDLPTTPAAHDSTRSGSQDAYLTGLDASGANLVYSTYLGGSISETGLNLAIDGQGSAYVTGQTVSADFPVTPGAFDTTFTTNDEEPDAFVTKLSLPVVSVSETVPPGGSASTNEDPTPGDPLGTSVTSPSGGTVTISEEPENSPLPGGFSGLGWRVQVTAPAATASNPLVLVFRVDASLLPNPLLGPVAIFKNGTQLPWCANPSSGIANPDPCIKEQKLLPNGDGEATVLSSSASTWDLALEAPPPYPAPSAASSLEVELVPVFRETLSASQCAARGGAASEHGAPELAPPAGPDLSCNPPGYVPGTAARLGPEALGQASLTAVPGDPLTPADEADLALDLSASDVRNRATGGDYLPNASGADLTLAVKLRLSDTYNGPSLADPATVADFDLKAAVECAPSAGPEGASCDAATSADAIQPDTIREGTDMVIQAFKVRLNDAGQNGIRGDADDKNFATQGIFVP